MKRHKTHLDGIGRVLLAGCLIALLGACAVNPPPLDWQMNARSAAERAVEAYLSGNNRVESLEFERMRRETARTGDATLMARAELLRCATRVASLVFEPCDRFEALRPDAALPERAYADYLGGRVTAQSIALLPAQHQAPASRLLPGRAGSDGDVAVLVGHRRPAGATGGGRCVAAGRAGASGRHGGGGGHGVGPGLEPTAAGLAAGAGTACGTGRGRRRSAAPAPAHGTGAVGRGAGRHQAVTDEGSEAPQQAQGKRQADHAEQRGQRDQTGHVGAVVAHSRGQYVGA